MEQRLAQVASWKNIPDFVSINYDEIGFEQVTDIVSKKGIKIEISLSSSKSVEHLTKRKLRDDFFRIPIEPQEKILEDAIVTFNKIETQIDNCGIQLPYLLHGLDKTFWGLLKLEFIKNHETRIGFEDTLNLSNGKNAKINRDLLEGAHLNMASCQDHM